MTFSLEKFEAFAYSRDREMGMRELVALLQDLDAHYGNVGENFHAIALQSITHQEVNQHVWTRAAAAATSLLSDRELFIAPEWRQRILANQRWLSALFAATPFRNADHVMRSLNVQEDKGDLTKLVVEEADLLKFCLLYSPESEVPLDLDAFWAVDKVLAAGLCLILLSPRFLGSPAAHAKRELILPWLSERLEQIEDVEQLPLGVLHDLYMHCSYADRPDKHDIKKPINALIQRKLEQNDLLSRPFVKFKSSGFKGNKPTMLVVLEWFTSSHAMWRVHSRAIEGAREYFHIVAMGYQQCVDEISLKGFDEFVAIEQNIGIIEQLRIIKATAINRKISVLYMPSVGMFPLTMWLANLRVASLQIISVGHPATTHSDVIDYVAVEEEFIGDECCFSEKLLKLPHDAMPYRPSVAAEGLNLIHEPNINPEVVNIAVCATSMKLNPNFLIACSKIVESCNVKIHFHFLIGQAQGLIFPNVQRVVKNYLENNVTVHPHQSYAEYMKVVSECDMFINPFPFGNTNGIIDTVSAGLVGVCKTGREVHEHIDEGLFKRLNMPNWLITSTIDEYVAAAVRLATNHEERVQLRKSYVGVGKVEQLFTGRSNLLGEMIFKLLLQNDNNK